MYYDPIEDAESADESSPFNDKWEYIIPSDEDDFDEQIDNDPDNIEAYDHEQECGDR